MLAFDIMSTSELALTTQNTGVPLLYVELLQGIFGMDLGNVTSMQKESNIIILLHYVTMLHRDPRGE